MASIQRFARRLLAFLRPSHSEAELNREVQAHLALAEEEFRHRGLPPAEARTAARRVVRPELQKDAHRDARSFGWLEDLRRDVHYAFRMVTRQPTFAIVALLTLALGIGANVVIFTVTNALLLRPMPVERSHEMVRVYNGRHSPFTYDDFVWFRDHSRTMASLIAEKPLPVALTVERETEFATAGQVPQGFFEALALRPALGRLLDRADRDPSAAEVVLTHAFWTRRFASDPTVVGRTVRLNEAPFVIVGVAPEGFASSVHGWRPHFFVGLNDTTPLTGGGLDDLGGSLYTTGRLAPGVSMAAAQAEFDVLMQQLLQERPETPQRMTVRLAPARGISDEIRQPIITSSGLLLVISAFVLAIACTNLGNLLLARHAARRRELGVRLAIGASRGRLFRLLLTEATILASGGALVAYLATYLAAMWTASALTRVLSPEFPIGFDLRPDGRVFLFTLAIATIAVLVFALAPVLQASRLDVSRAIRGADGRVSGRSRLQSAFLIIQVALCTALLAAGSLFLRSLGEARRIDPGFPVEHLVDARMTLGGARYTRETGLVFWERTVAAARAIPGVHAATLAAVVPLTLESIETMFRVEGAPPLADDMPRPRTYINVVDENYFETTGIRVVRGRAFTPQDREGAVRVVIVNETMARRTWPGEDPLGKRVFVGGGEGGSDEWRVVVGVAADIRYNTLGEDTPIFTYVPLGQNYQESMIVQVRARDAAAVSPLRHELMGVIRSLDRTLPPPTISTAEEAMQIVLLPAKVGAGLLGAFGLLALTLAGIGIFGVASNHVAQRTREIGIRTALGARPQAIVRWVLGRAARNVTWGAAAGLVLAFALGQLMTSFLYGITAADPITFVVVPVVLALTAALAGAIPARRAARVDPVQALRAE